MDWRTRDAPEPDDSLSGYDLAPGARAIDLPGEVVVRPDAPRAMDALAADLLAQAITCVRAFGDFHLAIGGDQSIEALYLRLMSDTELRALPWAKTHLWMTHERRVDERDPRRVATALREYVLHHSDIPAAQAHVIPIDDDEAATLYESTIRETLSWREPGHDRLDCVVLSLEESGYAGGRPILSMPNGDDALLCDWMAPSDDEPRTLALTPAFVRASRMIAVIGQGAASHGALEQVRTNPSELAIAPIAGELRWYLDESIVSGD